MPGPVRLQGGSWGPSMTLAENIPTLSDPGVTLGSLPACLGPGHWSAGPVRDIALPTGYTVPTCCPSVRMWGPSLPSPVRTDTSCPGPRNAAPCLRPQLPLGEGRVEGRDRGETGPWKDGAQGGLSRASSLTILRLRQSRQGQAVVITGAGVWACPGMEGLNPREDCGAGGDLRLLWASVRSQAGRWSRCALVPCQTCAGPGGGPPPCWVWCLCHPITGACSPTASRQGQGS